MKFTRKLDVCCQIYFENYQARNFLSERALNFSSVFLNDWLAGRLSGFFYSLLVTASYATERKRYVLQNGDP